MSTQGQPGWWHPLLRLHHRYVHKRATAAEAAAAELGVELHGAAVREALAYQRWMFPRDALKFLAGMTAFMLLAAALYQGECTPGGMFNPAPTSDCSMANTPIATSLMQWDALVVLALTMMWVARAWQGETIARCSQPLYPLLDLLASSAAVARPGTPYTESIKLSKQVSALALPLRTVARHAASDFGNRRTLRRELIKHLDRVSVTFSLAANQLASDRESAARALGELAAHTANGIAAGRFAVVLPADKLAQDSPLEPDRLDGRRLGIASIYAAVALTVFFLALSPMGAPAALVVSLALVMFPLLVYTLLAFRYGLSEATRLTRSIGGFFSASPPL
ncbi:hypothetical protein ABZ642_41880 [Streptomyces sp. NPDC007157]|uniref:hypothetical protein n=1 Tax=Streptomyces sp. NPDC007157 TaxID=3154681 RepID=UPI0033DD2508